MKKYNKNIISKEDGKEILQNELFLKDGILDLSALDQVKIIDDFAFASSKNTIKKVIFPNSLKEIGEAAFMLNQIEEIIWSKEIRRIKYGAFENNKIANLEFPEGVKVIEESIFAFNKIKKLTIPNHIVQIQNDAFINNEIEELIFSDDKLEIEGNPFWANENIKKVTINSELKLMNIKEEFKFSNLILDFLDYGALPQSNALNNSNLFIQNVLWIIDLENLQKLIIHNPKNTNEKEIEFFVNSIESEERIIFQIQTDEKYSNGLELFLK